MKKILMISLIVAASVGLAGCEGHSQTRSSHGHNSSSGHNSHNSHNTDHHSGYDHYGHVDGPVEYVEDDVHSDVH